MTNTYTVTLQLVAETSDALMERLEGWDIGADDPNEGVHSIVPQPEAVVIPPDLRPPQPPPTAERRLDSVDPPEGPAAGGTEITLTGMGFTNIGGVRFEGDGATGWAASFEVLDDTTMTCPTPAMPAGVVDVIAFDGDPGDAILTGGFTFT
jgi:hypothetical protein